MQCEHLEQSGQEQDELQRSTKRVKDAKIGGGQMEERLEVGDMHPKSYRDKLLGDFPGVHAHMSLPFSHNFGEEESDIELAG